MNDIRVLRSLKKYFGKKSRINYIHANTSEDQLLEEQKKRYIDANITDIAIETRKRFEKIRLIHRRYIDNIGFFDCTILNIRDLDNLYRQLNFIVEDENIVKYNEEQHAILFVICGSSFSGKDDLATAMENMDRDRIFVYRKATDRKKRKTDNDELIHYQDGKFPEEYEIIYEMQGIKYGIAPSHVWRGLRKGNIQILIVNDISTIVKLKNIFGMFCIPIFLHSNRPIDEEVISMRSDGVIEKEIARRLKGAEDLDVAFSENPGMFRHVLLNTTEREDLYDQAFNILDLY